MPLSTPEDLHRFTQLIAPWSSAYRFADCASVAMKIGNESPLLFGRIILYFVLPDHHQSFRLDAEPLSVRRAVIPIPEGGVSQLITTAGAGTLNINDERFSLKQEGQYLGSFLFPLHHPEVGSGVRLPTLRISGTRKDPFLQSRSFKPVEQLDWALKAADQPFDTFDELLLALGLPRLLQMGDMTTLEVVAGAPASILDSSRIQEGRAIINCRIANGLEPVKLKLGYKVQRGAVTDRSMIKGDRFQWKQNDSFQEGVAQIDVDNAPVLQAFLSYQETALHQWWVFDPDKRLNLRQAVYELFDPQLVALKTFVNGQGRETARDFEKGVAFLANLLGFAIVPFSVIPQLADGPDVIASTPNGNAAVIECTIGHLTENNKLAKLVRRTNLLKEKLRLAGHGHLKVQPVIVSLLSRAELQVELFEAGKHNVAVISKEELQTLINETILFPNAEELFMRIPELIPCPTPVEGQESLFPTQPS